tara:strand:- start:260 stop:469 length:210 start_codon:yes stop_codon:yes gene_type:complete
MKNLTTIKEGFKKGNTLMVIETVNETKYYFNLKHLMITRESLGYESTPKFYSNESDFYSAVKRHLKKQA